MEEMMVVSAGSTLYSGFPRRRSSAQQTTASAINMALLYSLRVTGSWGPG